MVSTALPSADDLVARLRDLGDPANVAGMMRFGISGEGALGVPVPAIRGLAKELRPACKADPESVHLLALALWSTGVHEARMLAAFIDVPVLVTRTQVEAWARDLDSWDVCDQLCGNLLDRTAFAWELCEEWAGRPETFVKRAGFALMTQLAVHDKKSSDAPFLHFLTLVEREADDDRPYVRKAVNWALRQIGKRDPALWSAAVDAARRLRERESRAARWVASDALRELQSDAVRLRLGL
jgi:3-methyladenine DNA glycosylase AlkD